MRWLVFNVVCRFVEVLFDLSHLGLECVKVPLVVLSFFLECSLQVLCGHVWLSQLCLSFFVLFVFFLVVAVIRSSALASCSTSSSGCFKAVLIPSVLMGDSIVIFDIVCVASAVWHVSVSVPVLELLLLDCSASSSLAGQS